MKNTAISISIPSNVYIGLKKMAEKDMRSARNYISRLIIEHVPENMLPKEIMPEPEKLKQIANLIDKKPDESHCKSCGAYVHMRSEQFKNNGELCAYCKKKKFENND